MALGAAAADERARIHEVVARERVLVDVASTTAVCLAYPSPYRVGMSSLGFQTLYRLLNEHGIGAHRAFLPDDWEPAALPWPAARRPVLAYESGRPLADHRIVAVSVAYELEVAGLVRLLEGSGIPVLAADRGPRDPIVVGGGPITGSNAAAVLPFCDLLIAGEAELELPLAVERILAARTREAAIAAAVASPHCIAGELSGSTPAQQPDAARAPREALPARSAILTPDTELHDMFLIEPERGCPRQCTFCVLRGPTVGGMRWLPAEQVLALVPAEVPRVGLVGAAVTDHPELERLVAGLVERGHGLGISSLRADRLTPGLLSNLAAGGYRTITVASDGISERMRRALCRRIDEPALERAAHMVRAAGLRGLKVYEMIGAPGETDADVDELIGFAGSLSEIVPLTLTISTFVAKYNTPLDGQPFLGVAAAEARLARIRKGLRGRVKLRPQSPRWAHVEYLIALHGAEGGHAVRTAVHAGGRYSDYVRAFSGLGPPSRRVCHGDEAVWARRKGAAADKRPARTLAVIGTGDHPC